MGLGFGDNIDYRGKKPLDERSLFKTISSMKSFNENYLPSLSICQNEEDGQIYIYNANNSIDETTGKWRVFNGGGEPGPQGPKGDPGASFTYDMFTPEQLARLTGPQGNAGENGVDGKSAYEIAINNGFVGSEQDWLASLKGSASDSHENKAVIDKLSESNGALLYDGNPIVNISDDTVTDEDVAAVVDIINS